MLDLSPFKMIECKKCRYGRSLMNNEINNIKENLEILFDEIKCSCGYRYTYIDGITQYLLSDKQFNQWHFVSDIIDSGEEQIIIGKSKRVKLKQKVPRINKIYITPFQEYAYLKGIKYDEDSFVILSSSHEKGSPPGSSLKVNWLLYGNSKNRNIPIWKSLLAQAKEEIIGERYSMALFISFSAFESFISTFLSQCFNEKGIPLKASEVILKSLNFDSGIYTLLLHIGKIDFRKFPDHKKWDKIKGLRNKVAHGKLLDISREDALVSFEVTVKSILFILLNEGMQ